MEEPIIPHTVPLQRKKKMGDFDSCRFDFRIDTKSGLTPSRRKKEGQKRSNYNTLFKCKTCGSLFENRPALLEHKICHNEFRCVVCDVVYSAQDSLNDHMLVSHGMFNKSSVPAAYSKPAAGAGDIYEEDDVAVFPEDPRPSSAQTTEENGADRNMGSPSPKKALNGSKSPVSSPVAKHRKILPSQSSLPPLISVPSSSSGVESPSLPSTAVISAAVHNVLNSMNRNNAAPTPPRSPVKSTPEPPPVTSLAPVQLSPQTQQVPAMLSPQTMMFSPMGAFPQIRYAFPQQVMGGFGSAAPVEGTAANSSQANPALPPGYVYINVPMFFNQANMQASMPQLIPADAASMLQQQTQEQPSAEQSNRSNGVHNGVTQNNTDNNRSQNSQKRSLDQADSTTSMKKSRSATPASECALVIQDPRSLSSTDFEQSGMGPIKIEPTSPEEITSEALDFSYRHDPVRRDVNISQAYTKEDNPLKSTQVIDLSNSPDGMDFEDDKAAMLDQYRDFSLMEKLGFEDSGVSKVDADSTSQTSSTKEDRNTPKDYSCDQCDFKAPNGATLTQHKAKAHKVVAKSGLNKLLGKLWQNKMKRPESEPEIEEEAKAKEAAIEQDTMPQFPGPHTTQEFVPTPQTPEERSPKKDVHAAALVAAADPPPAAAPHSSFTTATSPSFELLKFHTCKVCKQLFDSMPAMWAHMSTHKELRKFKCNLCSFKAVCRERLIQHKQEIHPEYLKNPWVTARPAAGRPRGTDRIRAAAPESRSSHHGTASLYQCPEEGCTQTFRTVGGLKNHQVSHLGEENNSSYDDESNSASAAALPCPAQKCSRTFPDLRSMEAHLTSCHPQSQHSLPRGFSCALCKYTCRQRTSLHWHMKNKHGLLKARTPSGRCIYVDDAGNVIVNEARELAAEENGVQQTDGADNNSLASVPSPKEIQAKVAEVMQQSLPDEHQRFVYNRIDGLSALSYANEPEEITIDAEGPLTMDKLAMHDRIKEEEEENVETKPIDMSISKEEDVQSEKSNNSSSLDLSQYSGEVIQTLGAVPATGGATYTQSPRSTPTVEKKECTLEIDSISSPSEDMQHFTSVLKLKYVGAQAKDSKRRPPPPVSAAATKHFNCQLCDAPFNDASKMWLHRLNSHTESVSIHCDTCSYSSPTKEDLQQHMLSTHGNELGNFKAFVCFICSKGYGTKSGLNHHMLRHSKEGPPALPCPYPDCKSKLHSKGSLKMHVRRQHGSGNATATSQTNAATSSASKVRCRYHGCGKTFSTTKHLKVHQMQHTGEMPLKCHRCDYACRQRNSMNWHMQSKHNLEKRVSDDGRHTYYV